jgi:hypothetical protein
LELVQLGLNGGRDDILEKGVSVSEQNLAEGIYI